MSNRIKEACEFKPKGKEKDREPCHSARCGECPNPKVFDMAFHTAMETLRYP